MLTQREEIEQILADIYDGYEAMASWETAFTDDVAVPFPASLLEMPVEVLGFRVGRDSTLQCSVVQGGKHRWLAAEYLDDVGLPADMAHLLELYRAWQGGNY